MRCWAHQQSLLSERFPGHPCQDKRLYCERSRRQGGQSPRDWHRWHSLPIAQPWRSNKCTVIQVKYSYQILFINCKIIKWVRSLGGVILFNKNALCIQHYWPFVLFVWLVISVKYLLHPTLMVQQLDLMCSVNPSLLAHTQATVTKTFCDNVVHISLLGAVYQPAHKLVWEPM